MGCYRQDMVVCTEDTKRGVVDVDDKGHAEVVWGDGDRQPLLAGWRTELGEPVWPMRPATIREKDALCALRRAPATTAEVESWLGLRGLSSALSRLKASGYVTRAADGRWSLTDAFEDEDDVLVRQDVQRPPVEVTTVAEAAGETPALFGHVELGGEQMLLVPVDADVVRLTAERDEARQWADRRGELLDIVSAALGGSWEGAVSRVEMLVGQCDEAGRIAHQCAEFLDNITTVLGSGDGMATVWGNVVERAKSVMRDNEDLRSMLGERTALLSDVCTALQCASYKDAPAAAKGMAEAFGTISDASHDRGSLLDRVAAAVGGGPWEEAVGKVETLRAERERALIAVRERDEALANARTIPDTLHTHITRQSQRADDAEAALRGVCKALGCEPTDVEDVVARLVAERGNLRRELGAAEQVERALLKALADAGAALAREQATALVNTVRARDMRRGEG